MKIISKYLVFINLVLVLVFAGCTMPFIVIESGKGEDLVLEQAKQELKPEKLPDPTATPEPETSKPLAPLTGSIGDLVWQDLNGNGRQDQGEPGWAATSGQVSVSGSALSWRSSSGFSPSA